jgi:uncharacterized damage-inducible protein DinB
MTLDDRRQALFSHYRQIRAELTAAFEGLSEAQMVEPSIDGWSVKDNLAHIALWDDFRADEIRRISAGFESVWRMPAENDEALNDIAAIPRRALSLRQVLWEFECSRQRVLDVIAAASERGLDDGLYGNAPLRTGHDLEHAEYIRAWRQKRGI